MPQSFFLHLPSMPYYCCLKVFVLIHMSAEEMSTFTEGPLSASKNVSLLLESWLAVETLESG